MHIFLVLLKAEKMAWVPYTFYFGLFLMSRVGDISGNTDWAGMAKDSLKASLSQKNNNNVAKNVILFIGDGMGISTVTASRIYKGQKMGNPGEETVLSFEEFPHLALSKVYGADKQVPGSGQTATALMGGVKTNYFLISLKDTVSLDDCPGSIGQEVTSIVDHFISDGRATGVVTTSRITHATPACAYGHAASRYWEGDVDMVGVQGSCKDLAYQLVYDSNDINVFLGGGRRVFLPNTTNDPETNTVDSNQRQDGADLTEIWKDIQKSKNRRYKYVWNKTEMAAVNSNDVDYLLGLFEPSHLPYVVDRNSAGAEDPTLAEMTSKAINILQKNSKGFFLMVEGARIDHAHHMSLGKRALEETLALEEAVSEAVRLTNEEDTLIIVTADHSHGFSISGYIDRGNDILGIAQPQSEQPTADGLPYTSLVYSNGPGRVVNGSRVNLTNVDTRDNDYVQESAIPLDYDTHSGEEVAIYALGPMSHLFHGVKEQHYVAHVMQYAACVGDYRENCRSEDKDTGGGRPFLPSSAAITLTVALTVIINV